LLRAAQGRHPSQQEGSLPRPAPGSSPGSKRRQLTLRGLVRSQDRPSGTGVITLSASSRHPQLGSGLLGVLTIPTNYEPDVLLALCHELNLAEPTSPTARSHFFGAWCPDPNSKPCLAFACFIPAASCRSGLIEAIALSLAARAAWATSFIGAASPDLKARQASEAHGASPNILNQSIGRVLEWRAAAARDRIHRHLGSGTGAPGADTSE
jgi:hypothetical protein